MPALIKLRLDPQRLIGELVGLFAVADKKVFARPVKMPIFRQPPRDAVGPAVFIETITSGALRNDGTVIFVGKIIDPWTWRIRIGNDVFPTV